MTNYSIESVTVDKDVLDFLMVIYFGVITDPFEAAAFRAYRDFNRTLRFDGKNADIRLSLRKKATDILQLRISLLDPEMIRTQGDFDLWHKESCEKIRQIYREEKVEFSWGQAQKWLNMTIKYLYIVGSNDFTGIFQFCHVPIDNFIFQIAEKELGIPRLKMAWSRCDDYNEYMAYQKELRSRIKGYDPLRWEFKYWMKEARQLAGNTGINQEEQ